MDIWVKRAYRPTKCDYCQQYVATGDYLVCGKLWLTKSEASATLTARKWLLRKYWHLHSPDGIHCWEEQAKYYIDRKPKPIKSPAGRKKLELTNEDKRARGKILNRRSTITQRIRAEWEKPLELIDYDEIVHLGTMLKKCKEEIEPLGGVPKSWLDNETPTTTSSTE